MDKFCISLGGHFIRFNAAVKQTTFSEGWAGLGVEATAGSLVGGDVAGWPAMAGREPVCGCQETPISEAAGPAWRNCGFAGKALPLPARDRGSVNAPLLSPTRGLGGFFRQGFNYVGFVH